MKNTNATLISFAIVSALFLSSCKTTKVEINTYSPAAIITIYGNTTVPLYDDSVITSETYKVQQTDEGIITGALNKALDKDDTERITAPDRINYAAYSFERKLTDANIKIIQQGDIQKSSGYVNTVKNFINSINNTKPAESYSVVPESNGITNKRIARETGAKILYYVHFKFQKVEAKEGVHTVGLSARTVMTVYSCDSKSRTIIAKDYSSTSDKYTHYLNNKYDKAELCSFFEHTIDNVINQFADDYLF